MLGDTCSWSWVVDLLSLSCVAAGKVSLFLLAVDEGDLAGVEVVADWDLYM